MKQQAPNPIPDFINALSPHVVGEIRTDPVTRVLYSTDASIYQIEPLGVFFPSNADEISAFMEKANEYDVPLLPRGSGSSLAGQAIGPGFIIDCSRHLNQIINITPEELSAVIEPGVVLSELNRSSTKFGLQFGPDPASAERATMGGVIANNATGAHSILYGMAVDNLHWIDTVLADGSQAHLSEIAIYEAERIANASSKEGDLYQAALSIRSKYKQDIVSQWPNTWRRASGYNINYLLPWSPSSPSQWGYRSGEINVGDRDYPPVSPGTINLANLIAGSEGTLGVIRQAKVSLVKKPRQTCLVLLGFEDLKSACEQVGDLLELKPSAIELIPANMIKLASKIPSFAKQISILDEMVGPDHRFPNLLAVEFSSEESSQLHDLSQKTVAMSASPSIVAEDLSTQQQIWNVRKVGLGLLMSIPGDLKPVPFVEDVSVPVNKLSQFVREFEMIMTAHETQGDFYAHASAGCLHIRPLIDLKNKSGVAKMRRIAEETIGLISRLGGAPSGEHGDGLARSEWLDKAFGPRVIEAFQELKYAADPKGLLNPGKLIDPPPMDKNLRFGDGYSTPVRSTLLDFSNQDGFIGAIDMCNGAGVCRKLDGLMCPSFQATREEMHSTRGRANLLRSMMAGNYQDQIDITPEEVFNALDLCLACKGCKSECPSAVDMGKIKLEFLEQYYQAGSNHRHPMRDYLFAYIGEISRIGMLGRTMVNYLLKNKNFLGVGEEWLGISIERNMPQLRKSITHKPAAQQKREPEESVLFLSEPFTEYFHPNIGTAARQILVAAGCKVHQIPVIGSGRTKLSKGFLKSARKQARKVIEAIIQIDPNGQMPIIGIEPSEIYTLKDEYLDFFPGQTEVMSMANRVFMFDEFLSRPGVDGIPRILRIANDSTEQFPSNEQVYLHGHCYQKSQPPAPDGIPSGVQATQNLLEKVGYEVELMDTGCCGMAGAFGYESEHYDLSIDIGELSLFPQLRQVGEGSTIAACGYSCLSQIEDGTGKAAQHFISLVHDRVISEHYER